MSSNQFLENVKELNAKTMHYLFTSQEYYLMNVCPNCFFQISGMNRMEDGYRCACGEVLSKTDLKRLYAAKRDLISHKNR